MFSNPIAIEQTDIWLVESYGNGTAYRFVHKPTQKEAFIQGDDALEWRKEYAAMQVAYLDQTSIHYKVSWNRCLAILCDKYLEDD